MQPIAAALGARCRRRRGEHCRRRDREHAGKRPALHRPARRRARRAHADDLRRRRRDPRAAAGRRDRHRPRRGAARCPPCSAPSAAWSPTCSTTSCAPCTACRSDAATVTGRLCGPARRGRALARRAGGLGAARVRARGRCALCRAILRRERADPGTGRARRRSRRHRRELPRGAHAALRPRPSGQSDRGDRAPRPRARRPPAPGRATRLARAITASRRRARAARGSTARGTIRHCSPGAICRAAGTQQGPAIIEQETATVVVPPAFTATIGEYGDLILERRR